MALSNEDRSDVSVAFGKKTANKVASATRDGTIKSYSITGTPSHLPLSKERKYNQEWAEKGAKTKALSKKAGSSFERMNKERKAQGYAPKKDGASKGLYDFLDKFDK